MNGTSNLLCYLVASLGDVHLNEPCRILQPFPVLLVKKRNARVGAENFVNGIAVKKATIEHRHARLCRGCDASIDIAHTLELFAH